MMLYHKMLRVFMAVVAVTLLFDSGILSPVTSELSNGAQQYVATAIGVSAVIPENELNKITAELSARERDLDAREAALEGREIDARAFDTGGTTASPGGLSTYILSILLFVLLVLITLNYVLDFLRQRDQRYAHAKVAA